LSITAAWMAYYNWRVTGNAWKMPDMVHEEIYGSAPLFLFQPAGRISEYRYVKIARVYRWLRGSYVFQRTWAGFVGEKWVALVNLWHFFLGIALSIPLLALPWVPAQSPLLAAGGHCERGLGCVTDGDMGESTLFCAGRSGLAVAGRPRGSPLACSIASPRVRSRAFGTGLGPGPVKWVRAVRLVSRSPTGQGVRYPAGGTGMPIAIESRPAFGHRTVRPDYNIHQDFVHNRADIDTAKIVWGRPMNPSADRQLVECFRDRHVWLLRAD
jgi:hypothetical protein